MCAARHRTPRARGSELETLQIIPERGTEVGARERDLARSAEPARRRPGVVASPLEFVAEALLLLQERGDPVGPLDLAVGATLGLLELVEDLRRQHVAADDRQVRRRGTRGRLLDESG